MIRPLQKNDCAARTDQISGSLFENPDSLYQCKLPELPDTHLEKMCKVCYIKKITFSEREKHFHYGKIFAETPPQIGAEMESFVVR